MKLLENFRKLGSSMNMAVKNVIHEMFGRDMEDAEVEAIVKRLKLSDILVLDTAYTEKNHFRVAEILGLEEELVEYAMQQGRVVTSAASMRPKPNNLHAEKNAANNYSSGTQTKTQTGTQTVRKYSSGSQNAVTTQHIKVDDDDVDVEEKETTGNTETKEVKEARLRKLAGIK